MPLPEDSRIRVNRSNSFPSRLLRYIFLIIIGIAVLVGFYRGANAAEDAGVILLREAGVSFVHPVSASHVIIFKGGEPTGFETGFETPEAVCHKLKGTKTVIYQVRFFNGPRASCK